MLVTTLMRVRVALASPKGPGNVPFHHLGLPKLPQRPPHALQTHLLDHHHAPRQLPDRPPTHSLVHVLPTRKLHRHRLLRIAQLAREVRHLRLPRPRPLLAFLVEALACVVQKAQRPSRRA